MKKLIQALKEDEEIQYLKRRCYEITGEWIPYHWECFNGTEEYREYMKKIVREYEDKK